MNAFRTHTRTVLLQSLLEAEKDTSERGKEMEDLVKGIEEQQKVEVSDGVSMWMRFWVACV